MKRFLVLIAIAASLIACKNDPKEEPSTIEESQELSQQVADASGLESWKDVKQVDFTFNVERNGEVMPGRQWQWNPQSEDVTLTAKGETITYNRAQQLDSLSLSADRAFINDVYWLVPQFKLAWDTGMDVSYPESADGKMVKVQYTGNGGYTPGDRYDMLVDENNMITKWMYYPGGTTEPAMTTSFEDYNDYNGIKIATNHRTPDGSLNIFFTDIKITK